MNAVIAVFYSLSFRGRSRYTIYKFYVQYPKCTATFGTHGTMYVFIGNFQDYFNTVNCALYMED
jgi:hypothetical protein